MDKINQKLGLPRVPSLPPKLVSRATILDGTVHTFFGPEQQPDCFKEHFNLPAADDPTTFVDQAYQKPGDWTPSGYTLRVPQIVWLSVYVQGQIYFREVPEEAGKLPESLPAISAEPVLRLIGSDGGTLKNIYGDINPPVIGTGGGTLGFGGKTYLPEQEPPNPTYGENDRMMAIFDEVKTRIEGLRPGRTFVMAIDWAPRFDKVYLMKNRYTMIIAPDIDEHSDPWFGTNFLHIHCGGFAQTGTGTRTSPFDTYFYDPNTHFDFALTDDDPYVESKEYLESSYEQFAGYRVMLFGLPEFPYPGVGDVTPFTPDPDVTFDFDDTGYEHIIREGDLVDLFLLSKSEAEGQMATVVFLNTYPALKDDQANLFMQAVATDLEHFGYSYDGAYTSLDADAIVELIASHYGFDPSNGRNL